MGMFDLLKHKEAQKEKKGRFAVAHWEPVDRPVESEAAQAREKPAAESAKTEAEEHKHSLLEKRKQQMRDKALGRAPKKDLGVCIPDHAKSGEERRHLPRKETLSPFDKLRIEHEKEAAEFNREFEEISAQAGGGEGAGVYDLDVEPIEPEARKLAKAPDKRAAIAFDGRPDPLHKNNANMLDRRAALEREVRGVIASRRPFGGQAPSEANEKSAPEKSPWEKAAAAFGKTGEPVDEIDDSIDRVEGYVPKFSKTAREKFTSEREVSAEPAAYGQFNVTGVYPGGDTTIISGEVTGGKINKRMSAQAGSATLRVNELKKGMEQVNELYQGEHGSIFVRGTINSIRYGDVLEFS